MYRDAQRAIGFRDQLSLEDVLADSDDRMCGLAGMLLEVQHQLIRYRYFLDFDRGRNGLFGRQPQATMQFAQIVCRGGRTHAAGTMLMQSTGHGATHSSHPVHSELMIVCMN